MKILILGSTGMLGLGVVKSLQECGAEVHGTFQKEKKTLCEDLKLNKSICFNARDPFELDLIGYDCVVNCIGIINTKAEENKENTIFINSVFPHKVSRVCKARQIPFIHITTDCVFNGKTGWYDEESCHTALDIYGRSKSLGEPSDCMVLRTSIIGEEIHTYSSLLEWVKSKSGQTIQGYTNHFWNGITTLQYGDIVYEILVNKFYEEKLFHIFSPHEVSKFTLVKMIADKFRIDAKIEPYEAPISINRTLKSQKDLVAKLTIPSLSEQINRL
jgi:dTDP-4-dehydrorhamnose reductase